MTTGRFKKTLKEHPAVVQRRNRAYMLMMIGDDAEKRARFLASHPEGNLPALPKTRGPRKPSAGPSEHQVQSAVISWWHWACGGYKLPEFALFAVPNGGARDPITGAKLKREGVRPGVPDLVLAAPRDQFHGLLIEMKVGDNKPSDKQQEFIEYLQGAGYCTSVHWTADSAIEAIKEYLR